MQDNITDFNEAIAKATLLQDYLKNNEMLNSDENLDPHAELLNHQFHNLKTKNEEKKEPENNAKFKYTRMNKNFQRESRKTK